MTSRARTGEARRAATRQKILSATKELLEQGEGVTGLSVAQIVDAAGVSRATFYAHFAGKREVMGALAENEAGRPREIVAAFDYEGPIDRDMLHVAAASICAAWAEQAQVLSGLIELAAYDEEGAQAWDAIARGTAAMVADVLRARRPDLDAALVDDLALAVVWATERICHQMLGRDPSPAAQERVAGTLTELLWGLTGT